MDFPTELPLSTLAGYSYSPDNNIVRTEMETGLARQRRRYTAVPTVLKVRWIFEQDEHNTFEEFYRGAAQHGAAWFNIQLANGTGVQKREVRFIKPYSATFNGVQWIVTADIEARDLTKVVA